MRLKEQVRKLRRKMPEGSWQGRRVRVVALTFDGRHILAEGEGRVYTIPIEGEPWSSIAKALKRINIIEHNIISMRRGGAST